jgi:hypothetical protein
MKTSIKIRSPLRLVLAILAALVARPAAATSNLFTPVTGADFILTNTGLQASLGHAQGGSNAFTVYGVSNSANTFTCQIIIQSTTTGAFQPSPSGSAGAFAGKFHFTINTNPPGGDYFYTAQCAFDNNVTIRSVVPNH